jgi:hypothetical protein
MDSHFALDLESPLQLDTVLALSCVSQRYHRYVGAIDRIRDREGLRKSKPSGRPGAKM